VNKFVWHKIENVKSLFESLFGSEFVSKYFSFTLEEIQKRHDIVHRNGKDEKRNVIFIKKEEVVDLISKINEFVRNIDKVLNKEVTDNFFTYYDSQ
jgi:K+/H+ antiporter YhaU regulatory subunit KhtT